MNGEDWNEECYIARKERKKQETEERWDVVDRKGRGGILSVRGGERAIEKKKGRY